MQKEKLSEYLKTTEFDIANANAAMFLADYIFGSYADSHRLHKRNFSPVCAYFSYNRLDSFYQIIEDRFLVEVGDEVYREYGRDRKSLDRKIREHQALTVKEGKIWNEYEKNRKKNLDRKILGKYYKKFMDVSRRWWYYGSIGEDKGRVIERRIIPAFAKRHNLPLEKANEIFNILSHPKEQAIFNLERKDFLDICISVSEDNLMKNIVKKGDFGNIHDPVLMKKIKNYLKKYFWIRTDFLNRSEITEESLLRSVQDEIGKRAVTKIREELDNLKNNFLKIEKEKKETEKKMTWTKEDREMIYFAKRTIYWIDQRKLGMTKEFYYIFTLLDDLAKLCGMKSNDLILYTAEEIGELIASGRKSSKKILDARHDGVFIVWGKGGHVRYFFDPEGEKMLELALKLDQKEVKGIVASRGRGGKITGRARIVLNPAKTDFKKGEILVTSMTRVEFVPLMRRAKAIVTNEGGLACHAAIVSRELGIPAVIGTKNATKFLHDGDIIEIDLKSGMVWKK